MPTLSPKNFDAQNQHWFGLRVYYEDTDFTGFVYHANYLRYFERGRSEFLRDTGMSNAALLEREDPLAFTLTRVAVDYKQAARIDDELRICTRSLGLKGVRMPFEQICWRGDTMIARAEVTAVMIHPDGRVRRPPLDLKSQMSAYNFKGEVGA